MLISGTAFMRLRTNR
ncbi:erythromycin resistance leader peptide [Corynebacterium appendicis]